MKNLQSFLHFCSAPVVFIGRTVAVWMPRWCIRWRSTPRPPSSVAPVCRSWPGRCPTARWPKSGRPSWSRGPKNWIVGEVDTKNWIVIWKNPDLSSLWFVDVLVGTDHFWCLSNSYGVKTFGQWRKSPTFMMKLQKQDEAHEPECWHVFRGTKAILITFSTGHGCGTSWHDTLIWQCR